MGAINNAFNQAVGAAAGAALAVKHAQESDFSKMNAAEHSALVARNQSREADAEANAAVNEAEKDGGEDSLSFKLAAAGVKAKELEKEVQWETNRKNGSIIKLFEKKEELKAAQKALGALKDKYDAITDLRDRAAEQRAYAEKATKIEEEAQQRYQNKWGGIR